VGEPSHLREKKPVLTAPTPGGGSVESGRREGIKGSEAIRRGKRQVAVGGKTPFILEGKGHLRVDLVKRKGRSVSKPCAALAKEGKGRSRRCHRVRRYVELPRKERGGGGGGGGGKPILLGRGLFMRTTPRERLLEEEQRGNLMGGGCWRDRGGGGRKKNIKRDMLNYLRRGEELGN